MSKLTILGCGSSSGVPVIGCQCGVCTSGNPKNTRTRVSVFIQHDNGRNYLIDTSPDLRQQALRHNINRVDAIILTHDHADHTHGIDDIRPFNYQAQDTIPLYADTFTMQRIREKFPYIFYPKPENNIWYRPAVVPQIIPTEPIAPFDVLGFEIQPIWQLHGKTHSLGFRFGNVAYCTDVKEFPTESFGKLDDLDIWIIDCLRYTESWTHSTLEQTLQWVEQLKPRLAILTHMAHDLDYEKLIKELPENVVPGYDGMELQF